MYFPFPRERSGSVSFVASERFSFKLFYLLNLTLSGFLSFSCFHSWFFKQKHVSPARGDEFPPTKSCCPFSSRRRHPIFQRSRINLHFLKFIRVCMLREMLQSLPVADCPFSSVIRTLTFTARIGFHSLDSHHPVTKQPSIHGYQTVETRRGNQRSVTPGVRVDRDAEQLTMRSLCTPPGSICNNKS